MFYLFQHFWQLKNCTRVWCFDFYGLFSTRAFPGARNFPFSPLFPLILFTISFSTPCDRNFSKSFALHIARIADRRPGTWTAHFVSISFSCLPWSTVFYFFFCSFCNLIPSFSYPALGQSITKISRFSVAWQPFSTFSVSMNVRRDLTWPVFLVLDRILTEKC